MPLVVGIVLVVALGYILMITLTDLADRLVDPLAMLGPSDPG